MPTVHANGIDLDYEISGSGPPLCLIMGMGCSARQWQWMVPVFAESFTVITFDNRGAGRSGKPGMDYSTEMFADDTCALLDALDIPKTHLFGVSVGGMEALFMQLGAAREHDTVGLVKNITVPTLVISGTKDPIAPVENARFLAGQILGSTLAEIEGVRHAFWVEKYGEACGIINDFLKS